MSGTVSSTLTASGGSGTSGTINIPDYTSELGRIATALETIATQTTVVATQLTSIEGHQSKLRQLGEGSGIHVISPYDYLGLISVYKSLVEQGDILKPASVQKSASKVAASKITEYLNAISSLPKQF